MGEDCRSGVRVRKVESELRKRRGQGAWVWLRPGPGIGEQKPRKTYRHRLEDENRAQSRQKNARQVLYYGRIKSEDKQELENVIQW